MYELSEQEFCNSIYILQALNLFDCYNEIIQMHRNKKTSHAFVFLNLGEKSLPLFKLFNLIETNSELFPPRTGHIGNWNDMLDGYVAQRNDNTIICSQKRLGYPLIFDLTLTENQTLTEGDLTYLPGSIVNRGERQVLKLYTWNGTDFIERSRETPLFVPFVFTKVNGEFAAITSIHRRRYEQYHDIKINMFSSVVMKYKEIVENLLFMLIDDIGINEDANNNLRFIVNRFANLDGQVCKEPIEMKSNGYYVGNMVYKSKKAFVEAIMIPYVAATNPDEFFSSICELPDSIPLLSNNVISILCAALYTHFPNRDINDCSANQAFNVHIQWGGIAMAGCLPKKTGYFTKQVRYIRSIYHHLVEKNKSFLPIFFLLIPSCIFLIWPNRSEEKDIDLVNELVNRILNRTTKLLGVSERELQVEIMNETNIWFDSAKVQLSNSFKKRFTEEMPVALELNEIPMYSQFIEPTNFLKLTVQQASMLVSALFECSKEDNKL